jgi:putative DNA primase/helicase
MSLMEAALAYAERGWSVFPLHDKRRPCVQWKEYQTSRPDADQIRSWWTEYPDAYIGLALGPVSGVLRVDVEGNGYTELEKLGGLPDTMRFKSPGGHGWLFQHCDGVTSKEVWSGEGEHDELRIQAAGAYTCIPPSPGYSWIDERPPAAIPRWMLDYYSGLALKELEKELRPTLRLPDADEVREALAFIPPDSYDTWVHVGMALKNSGEDNLELWDKWSQGCKEKYKGGECQRKWDSFIRTGLTTRSILYWAEKFGYRPVSRHEPLTELGNARILARMGEGRIKHSEVWGWLAWDGQRWAMEGAEKVTVELQKQVLEYRLNRAVESLRRLMTGDRQSEDYERRKKSKLAVVAAIRRHESERSVHGSRVLAESEPSITCDYRKFNLNPWLLNCSNGTLNLRNGELMTHDPESLITQLCPTSYVDSAECPRWDRFLREVFADNTELILWVQRLCGYCLTGVISEHILPIFHGTGRNGKSTFVKTIMNVLGPDYSGTTPSGFLTMSHNEGHPTKLVPLYGRRFVADLETGDGAKLNEELVKRLTGGDELTVRRMHENFWSFEPTHKLLLCTNYEPKVKGADVAIWSRIKLVPFNEKFEGDKQDTSLVATLARETSGILRWMLDGCLAWQREGLHDVKTISEATDVYRDEQDSVQCFFQERMELLESGKIRKAEVASAYKGWCMGQGVEPVSRKSLDVAMLKLGAKDGDKFWLGVKL